MQTARQGDDVKPFWQTTLQAQQTGTCLDCGRTPAKPYDGDNIPYCAECKRKHARKRRKEKDANA